MASCTFTARTESCAHCLGLCCHPADVASLEMWSLPLPALIHTSKLLAELFKSLAVFCRLCWVRKPPLKEPCKSLFFSSKTESNWEKCCYQEVLLVSVLLFLKSLFKLLSSFKWKFSVPLLTLFVMSRFSPAGLVSPPCQPPITHRDSVFDIMLLGSY